MEKKKIAWIEDDHDEIPALVRLLELDGHEVLRFRTRKDVEKGLEEILSADAIILDIILPPLGDNHYQGVSILKMLRKEYAFQKPVIVCTVVRNPEVMNALEDLDVSSILQKPVRPSHLYDVVTNAMGE